MSNYARAIDFAAKDGLTTGNPAKLVKGTEIGSELDAVATMSATKANKVGGATVGNFIHFAAGGDLADSGKATPSGDVVGTSDTQTLTSKTINLTSNTLTGTKAQFNAAMSDDDFCTLTGTETLSAKTLTSPAINGATINSTSTIDGITATNLVDKSAAETITGSWTFSTAPASLGSVTSKLTLLTSPESLTMTTTGAWTTINNTTLGNAGAVSALIAIQIHGVADAGGLTLQLRAESGSGSYQALYDPGFDEVFIDPGYDRSYGQSICPIVKLDANSDFQYYLSYSPANGTGSITVTATLIGYITEL